MKKLLLITLFATSLAIIALAHDDNNEAFALHQGTKYGGHPYMPITYDDDHSHIPLASRDSNSYEIPFFLDTRQIEFYTNVPTEDFDTNKSYVIGYVKGKPVRINLGNATFVQSQDGDWTKYVMTLTEGLTKSVKNLNKDGESLKFGIAQNALYAVDTLFIGNPETQHTMKLVDSRGQPPVLGKIGSQSVIEDSTLEFVLTATDTDTKAADLLYTTNATSGTLSGNKFTWTPGSSDVGKDPVVRFAVYDLYGGTDYEDVVITVLPKPDMQEPTIMSALLDLEAGTLNISFDEQVKASGLNASKISIHDDFSKGGGPVTVISNATTSLAPDSTNVVVIHLTEQQVDAFSSFILPILYVQDAFASDTSGNQNKYIKFTDLVRTVSKSDYVQCGVDADRAALDSDLASARYLHMTGHLSHATGIAIDEDDTKMPEQMKRFIRHAIKIVPDSSLQKLSDRFDSKYSDVKQALDKVDKQHQKNNDLIPVHTMIMLKISTENLEDLVTKNNKRFKKHTIASERLENATLFGSVHAAPSNTAYLAALSKSLNYDAKASALEYAGKYAKMNATQAHKSYAECVQEHVEADTTTKSEQTKYNSYKQKIEKITRSGTLVHDDLILKINHIMQKATDPSTPEDIAAYAATSQDKVQDLIKKIKKIKRSMDSDRPEVGELSDAQGDLRDAKNVLKKIKRTYGN